MRFTEEQTAYIIAHYATKSANDIADELGVTAQQVRGRAHYLKQTGRLKAESKIHQYSDADDAYILEHYHKMTSAAIAKHLGVTSANVRKRAQRLQAAGRVFAHAAPVRRPQGEPLHDDGYENVPWWMRQGTRTQRMCMEMYPALERD